MIETKTEIAAMKLSLFPIQAAKAGRNTTFGQL